MGASKLKYPVVVVVVVCSVTLILLLALLSAVKDWRLVVSDPRIYQDKSVPRSLASVKLKNSEINLEDIFISIKTSVNFHKSRVRLILKTWYTLAEDHIWFFTDKTDPILDSILGGQLKVTKCGSSHKRKDLVCKMSEEIEAFLKSKRKWFCHFDDDNYVNPFALLWKLREFDYEEDWYLGKPSLNRKMSAIDADDSKKTIRFWFGTGGAGVCISNSLAHKMAPHVLRGKFLALSNKYILTDDVAVGFLSEHILGVPLTVVPEFHSHIEQQKWITMDDSNLQNHISFGYRKIGNTMNTVYVDGYFDMNEDPTRFMSLHCKLFPNFDWCKKAGFNESSL